MMLHAVSDAGAPLWTGVTGDIIDLASPAVAADGTVYIGSEDKFLYAVHADGSLRWTYTDGSRFDATPCIRADGSIIAAAGSHVVALDGATGAFLWSFHARNSIRSSPACAADGAVYFGSDDSTFYCLEASGAPRWALPVGSPVHSSPAIGADGAVYFGTYAGTLYALGAAPAVDVVPAPRGLRLAAPAPSPARAGVVFTYESEPGRAAELSVVDVAGRRVARLEAGGTDGAGRAAWDLRDQGGRRVPPGVYRVRLSDGRGIETRSFVVLP